MSSVLLVYIVLLLGNLVVLQSRLKTGKRRNGKVGRINSTTSSVAVIVSNEIGKDQVPCI